MIVSSIPSSLSWWQSHSPYALPLSRYPSTQLGVLSLWFDPSTRSGPRGGSRGRLTTASVVEWSKDALRLDLELRLVQAGVQPPFGEKIIVEALLHDPPPIHDDDAVYVVQG